MSVVAVERFFSVIAEFADGSTRTIKVRGESPSEVYQQVRAMPDVRRVGRVSEVSEQAFASQQPERSTPQQRPPQHQPRRQDAAGRQEHPGTAEPTGRDASRLLGNNISGPRVVRHARPTGGEQPFKYLVAPPGAVDRPPPPPKPVVQVKAPVAPAAQPAPVPAPAPVAEVEATEETAATSPANTGRELRIVKSRRRDGLPYLLQRGAWRQQGSKRVFDAGWEKGFAERAQAEKHLAWLQSMEQDHAEIEQHGE